MKGSSSQRDNNGPQTSRKLPCVIGTLVVASLFALARILGSGNPSKYADQEIVIQETEGYLTIVDAGSSGCRAHVFRWSRESSGDVTVDPEHDSYKVRPGLSSFAENPEEAGASLDGLLDFMDEQIPLGKRASSPIYLKATAGLRMLPEEKSEAILDSVREKLASSDYLFDPVDGAQVIAGHDEGGFGWMTVNYLMKNLGGGGGEKSDKTYVGVIEMGGASAQVTQIGEAPVGGGLRGATEVIPEDDVFDFEIGDTKYELYAKSYLGYGLEQARVAVTEYLRRQRDADGNSTTATLEDPCLNAGYKKTAADGRNSVYDGADDVEVIGTGDYDACHAAIDAALFVPHKESECPHPHCSGIESEFQPSTLADSKLLVFENFYYTASMLGMSMPDTNPANFRFQAKNNACSLSWTDLEDKFPVDGSDKEDLTKLCFSATYLYTFLKEGLGIKNEKSIVVQQEVDGADIDWSLGAAIHEANRFASK